MCQNNIGYPLQPLCTKRASFLTTLASEGCGMTISNTSGVTALAARPALVQLTRQRVSVVIPALNEARNLEHVFAALRRLGNRALGMAVNWGDGFEIETLLNLRAAIAGLTIAEVPSFEHDRLHGTSDLKTFRDGQRVLRTIVTERSRG